MLEAEEEGQIFRRPITVGRCLSRKSGGRFSKDKDVDCIFLFLRKNCTTVEWTRTLMSKKFDERKNHKKAQYTRFLEREFEANIFESRQVEGSMVYVFSKRRLVLS